MALKIVDLDKPQNRSRAENLHSARNEVRIVSRLDNPYIVGIYDLVTLDDRFVAIVMEFVEGRTLREMVVSEGPLPPGRALEWVRQVSNGLHEAHDKGVVHRDVKPENLLIESLPDGEDFVRVTDFGIASPAQSPSPQGLFIGTPLWASPEQVLGLPLDRRSDIYSLGATLYFLLTGQPPFTDDGYRKILSAHIATPAPRLSDAGPRHFSPPLENLVATMLSKSPDDRPASLDEVRSRLERLQASDRWDSTSLSFDSPVPFSLDEDSATAHIDAQPRGNCMQEVSMPLDLAHHHCAAIRQGRIASAAGDRLDVTTLVPRAVHPFQLPRNYARSVDLNNDLAIVGHEDGSVVIIDFEHEPEVVFRDPDARPIVDVAMDRAGRLQLVGTTRGDVYGRGLRPNDGWDLLGRGRPVTSLCVSDDAQFFAIGRRDGTVEVYSAADPGTPFVTLETTTPRQLAMTADGHLLAVLDEHNHVEVWGVDTGRMLYTADRESGRILALQFTDNTLMGLCEDAGAAFLIDLQCRQAGACNPSCTLCHLEDD